MEAVFEIVGVLSLDVVSALLGAGAASDSDGAREGSLYRTLSAISTWVCELLAIGFLLRGFWLVVWVYGK